MEVVGLSSVDRVGRTCIRFDCVTRGSVVTP